MNYKTISSLFCALAFLFVGTAHAQKFTKEESRQIAECKKKCADAKDRKGVRGSVRASG